MLSKNRDDTLLHLVPEFVIPFALLAQALAIEDDGSRHFSRPRIEPPVVRRHQPRPSEDIPVSERLHRHAAAAGNRRFERDPAGANEVEMVGPVAFTEDQLTGVEA